MTHLYSHALFATDLSACSRAVSLGLPALREIGVRRITMLHVARRPDADERAEVERKLAALALELEQQGLAVDIRIEEGQPSGTICAVAGESAADLIVMGTRGEDCEPRLLLGNTAAEVLYATETPLLLVRVEGEEDGLRRALLDTDTFRRILLATDGSDEAASAERTAQLLASDAEVTVFLTVTDVHAPFGVVEAESLLQALAAEVEAPVTIRVEPHPVPWGVIRRLVTELSLGLIVVGKRGMGMRHERLLGSTAEGVASRSGRSVLIVPERTFVAV